MDTDKLRQDIKQQVAEVFDMLDESGRNTTTFTDMINNMSDRKFTAWLKAVKTGDAHITLEMPNIKSHMSVEKIYEAAEKTGTLIFQKIKTQDPVTGRKYTTPVKFPILQLPVRRTQQYVEKKMSLPSTEMRTDAMTGQVTGESKSSTIGKEEIQILHNRGLENVLKEFLQIRGGNPGLFSKMQQQLEENGVADIDPDDPTERTRVSRTAHNLLLGMMLDQDL